MFEIRGSKEDFDRLEADLKRMDPKAQKAADKAAAKDSEGQG